MKWVCWAQYSEQVLTLQKPLLVLPTPLLAASAERLQEVRECKAGLNYPSARGVIPPGQGEALREGKYVLLLPVLWGAQLARAANLASFPFIGSSCTLL